MAFQRIRDISSRPNREVPKRPITEVLSRPNREASSRSNRKVPSRSNREISRRPNKKVSSQSNREVTSRPNRKVPKRPNREVSSRPNREASRHPNREVPSRPNREVSSRPTIMKFQAARQQIRFKTPGSGSRAVTAFTPQRCTRTINRHFRVFPQITRPQTKHHSNRSKSHSDYHIRPHIWAGCYVNH